MMTRLFGQLSAPLPISLEITPLPVQLSAPFNFRARCPL